MAVALSARATDKGVNKATRALFQKVSTPQQMLALGEEKPHRRDQDHRAVSRQGEECDRARRKILVEKHGGEVPRDREALQELPGVGRKTANVVLNVAFGEKTMAVDTHIFRVSNRTNLAPGKDVLAVELALEKIVPDQYALHAHHWLILHGRYTCIARKPLCPICVVRDLCRFKDKTKELPVEKPERRPGAGSDSVPARSGCLRCRWATRPAARQQSVAGRAAQSAEAEGIGGAGGPCRQGLDMPHRLAARRTLEEEKGAAGGAVIAPHLVGAVLADKLRRPSRPRRLAGGEIEISARLTRRRGARDRNLGQRRRQARRQADVAVGAVMAWGCGQAVSARMRVQMPGGGSCAGFLHTGAAEASALSAVSF